MPGLAASSMIFENIKLDSKKYSLHRIDWIQPKKNEILKMTFSGCQIQFFTSQTNLNWFGK